MVIAQDTARVEIYTRSEVGWHFQEIEDLTAIIPLDALGIDLPLAEIYDEVPLTEAMPTATR